MKKILVVLFILNSSLFTLHLSAQQLTIEQRIDTLMAQMTLEEKIGQMNQLCGGWFNPDLQGQVRTGQCGSILNSANPHEVNYYQKAAVEESRLHIPLVFGRDIIHGFKTTFPIPLGQSTTWNTELVQHAAEITAKEAIQTGIRWTFSPMVDVARDPRWGRIAEGYGEDTYLASQMGVACVRGYQKDNRLAACVKHFAAYGASEGGRDYNTTWIPEVQLRETYLPPFKACAEAGAMTFMCSFNEINGVPSSANRHLNADILRGEWKYDGMLVSDWASSANMMAHGNVADLRDATIASVKAGMEMDMEGHGYPEYLKSLVDSGEVTIEEIDACVRDILRLKFRLGLFEHPYADETPGTYFSEEARSAAQQACEESAVLLKNDGILPLNSNLSSSKIFLAGPLLNTQHDQNGTWNFDGVDSLVITPLMAMKEQMGDKITYQTGKHWSREILDANAMKALQKQAKKADVIVYFAGEESILSGEARCRTHLDLPGNQMEQLKALKATGKPVVVVLMAGRPLCIGDVCDLSDALIYAYHGGTMQGPALCNLLTGKAIPSGHLTSTFPQYVGQVPMYYNRKNTGRPASTPVLIDSIAVDAPQFSLGESSYWLEYGDKPLFPFGYGESYTTFEFSNTRIALQHDGQYQEGPQTGDIATMRPDWYLRKWNNPALLSMNMQDTLYVQCDIKNTGKYDAKVVAQLYIRDLVSSITRPVCELKGFQKPFIKAGETATVTFALTKEDLAYWHLAEGVTIGADGKYEFSAEPGDFVVSISSDSDHHTPARFTLNK